jgi:hypothetical protein
MSLSLLVKKILLPLKWRPERKATFTNMVMSVVKYGNVQHHALARGLKTLSFKAKLERIRRFFAKQVIDEKVFAYAMVFNTFNRIPKMHLILDRTNWKYGQTNINILALTARIGKITFTLFWRLMPHQGCSDLKTRQELLEQFKETFGLDCIQSLTADREFIGKEWLTYLCDNKVPFFSV